MTELNLKNQFSLCSQGIVY